MARPGPLGNRRGRLFPRVFRAFSERLSLRPFARLLQGLSGAVGVSGAGGSALQQRLRSSGRMARTASPHDRLATDEQGRGSLDPEHADCELRPNPAKRAGADEIAQLFSSDLIFLSNSSNEVSPLIFSPLMKKVGVESTFSTSAA